MANKFLHIYIVPREGVTRLDVEAKIGKAIDWIRYGSGVYIVYTSSDPARWKARLIDLVKPTGNLLIVQIDVRRRKGFMSEAFWAWITKRLDSD